MLKMLFLYLDYEFNTQQKFFLVTDQLSNSEFIFTVLSTRTVKKHKLLNEIRINTFYF